MQGRESSCIQGRVTSHIALAGIAVATAVVLLLVAHIPEAAFGGKQQLAAPKNLKIGPKKWTKKNSFKVTWKNPKGTKVVGAYYKIGLPPSGPRDGIYVSQKKNKKKGKIKKIKVGKPGNHSIYVWLKDKAGNVSEKNRATGSIKFDNTSPEVPASFKKSPGGWSSVNSFSVSWNSVASTDAAPIVGAYYKIGSPPKRKKQGKYVKLQDGSSNATIDGLTVEAEGSHPIYVWLKDAAGNVSAKNRAEGHLKFDKTPPDVPQKLAVVPDGWTTKNNFTVSWINPDPSETAPITGAYYKIGAHPTKVDDGSYSKLSYRDRRAVLYGLQVPTAGKHTLYVWLKDAAGNVSYKSVTSGYLLYAPKKASPPKRSQPREPRPKPPDSDPLGSKPDMGSPTPSDEGASMPQFDPPLITQLGMTRKYFRVKGMGNKSRAGRWKAGTKIGFTLSRSSEAIFTVVRNISGRKRDGSCVKMRRKLRRKIRQKSSRCSMFKTVGSFTYQGQEGSNKVKFTGRLNGKRLRPGLYHVYVRVGGTDTSAPPFLSFRVVRGR